MSSPADVIVTTYTPYTEDVNLPPGMIFPTHGYQLLSSFILLFGLSVLTYCFARRSDFEGMWTWKGMRDLSWPKICVVLIFADSWAFVFCAGLLVTGAGLSTNVTNCSLAIFSCIILYAGSKLFIYMFLIEKVYIVWAPHGARQSLRWKTPIYKICMGLLTPLAVILAILIWGRLAVLRDGDRVCVIGLRKAASLSLLCYDLFMTLVLTALFVFPLWRSTVSPRLRKVASRTLVASTAALITSCANVAILTILHGKELGWVCLSSCGTDVTLNALAIYWVTKVNRSSTVHSVTPPTGPVVTNSSGNPTHNPMSPGADLNRPSSTRVGQKASTMKVKSDQSDIHSTSVQRTTHFADEPSKVDAEPTESPTSSPRTGKRKSGRLFASIADAWRVRTAPVEEHTMSVQVTVTTEHQVQDSDYDDEDDSCKYPPVENDIASFTPSNDVHR